MYCRFRRSCVAAFVMLLASPGVSATWAYSRPIPGWSERFDCVGAKARFEKIVRLVEDSNAPDLTGHQRWRSLLETYRPRIERCADHRAFAEAVNDLLKSTKVSHFTYYTDEEWGYWHLRHYVWSEDPLETVEQVGIYPQRIGGRWFVRGLIEGSPVASTKMRVGDEVLSVDGVPFTPIQSFKGKAGRPTHIRLRRKPGLIYSVIVEPVKASLYRTVQRAMRKSIRVIEHNGMKMAYMHGWTMLGAGAEYEDLVDIQEIADGLLLDYRDGCGGTWHVAARFLLGRRDDPGEPRRNPKWTKPVVILTDVGTRSAKEILVDGVKRYGRGPLVGAPTPGAVTSVGGVRRVGEDGLIMLPGRRFDLEGNPTEPDYPVTRPIPYCAGADPQMEKAKQVLADLIESGTGRPARHTVGQIR